MDTRGWRPVPGRRYPRVMRLACAVASLLILGLAGSASAAPPTREHGAYCTPAGCSGRTASSSAQAASFGLAVLAAGGLARGRSRRDA